MARTKRGVLWGLLAGVVLVSALGVLFDFLDNSARSSWLARATERAAFLLRRAFDLNPDGTFREVSLDQ